MQEIRIGEITNYLDERFPKITACDFDQNIIGLTIGSANNKTDKVLLALDLTIEVAKQAKEIGANLIITHHPFIFNPITKIIFDNPQGEIIKFMCDNNITTYSMHTNLDCGVDGVNDILARKLGLNIVHEEAIKDDMLRCGEIKECTLKELADKVKETFKLSGLRIVGDMNKKIKRIGILGGSGGSIPCLNDALREKLDCYITGEIHLDKAIYANQRGLCLLEVNHGVERFVFEGLITELEAKFGNRFVISDINTDPLISY